MGKAQETHYDLIVAGGGLSGTLAAVAAAREGCRVLLLERNTALGGMATFGLVQPITCWGIGKHFVLGGTGRKLLESLAEKSPDAATGMSPYGPVCDAEFLKYELERLVMETGITLRYHTWIRDAETALDGRITAIKTFSKGGEERFTAKLFVDATGDADLAAFAGVPFDLGSQGITLMFIVAGIDSEARAKSPELRKIYEEHAVGYRGFTHFWHPRENAVYLNITEVEGVSELDPDDLTFATVECRRQAWEILEVLQNYAPGFENAYIEQTAPVLGVRESRRIHGAHCLTLDEVLAGTNFPDTIARAACPVDVHGREENGHEYYALKRSYGIPYRSLYNPDFPNLIVTGRPISADHASHSSLRRMAPGCALGEAAGLAASFALESGDVRSVDTDALQQKLLALGAILAPEPKQQDG